MEGSQENKTEKDVHLFYKNLGETPLQAIQRFKIINPFFKDSTVTYAGRLDPMAEGLLIFLTDKKVVDKEEYLNLPKTYEIEILWGFETDTLDLLGKVTNHKPKISKEDQILSYLEKTKGKLEQKYPAYSSRPVNGKPLFEWAREGRLNEIEIPKHKVEIYETEYISRLTLLKSDLEEEIRRKISLVSGDFRQKEILDKWREVLELVPESNCVVDKIILTVSSGFYVRQFISDMADDMGLKAITFNIKRTKIGDFVL